MRRGIVAAAIVQSVLACGSLAHASEAASPSEYVGVELAPGWLNVAPSADIRQAGTFDRYSLGIAGTLRLVRLGWGRWYWTPLQIGAGRGTNSAILGHLSTEVGLRELLGKDRFIEVGAAAGGGFLFVLFDTWCDGHCREGGMPVVVSPVVRLGLIGRRATVALFTRALFPVALFKAADAYGMAFLFGLDVGLGRH